MMMKTNGPSGAAAAAVVAGVLARPPRRATPETLSLDSVTTQPTSAAETARTNTAAAVTTQVYLQFHKFENIFKYYTKYF